VGIQILANPEQGAVFYSSSTEWAFGPVMQDADVAEAFLRHLRPADPRLLDDVELERRWNTFQQKLTCPQGHNNASVTNFGNGDSHFICMQRNCPEVWDLQGEPVIEPEEEEEDIEF